MKIVNLSKAWPVGLASLVAAMAALAFTAASGAATAGPFDETPPSYVVHYTDLDPAKAADAARLLRRIEHGAEQVCGAFYAPDLNQRAVHRQCRAEAIGRAMREANLPMVTALAQGSAPSVALAGE